jgi:four helix bundle protein
MNDLQVRILKFSVQVSNQTDRIASNPSLESVVKQINKSATSVGANYSEAQSASSKKDFHNKVRIALKEARETEYWLFFLFEKLKEEQWLELKEEALTLVKILTSIARKTDPDNKH